MRPKELLSLAISSATERAINTRFCSRLRNNSKTPNYILPMLSWAITFLIIALIAAILGFGGIAGTAVGIAKILFFVFLILFLISMIGHTRSPKV